MYKFYLKQLRSIALLITMFGIFLTGCSDKKLQQLYYSDTILAFGDSLTSGVGVTAQDSYPQVLASLTGLNVINAGISGETTSEGLSRFKTVLDSEKPALVILLEGGNDILRNLSSAETKNNLGQMIKQAKQSGANVVLVGVPEKTCSPVFTLSTKLWQKSTM